MNNKKIYLIIGGLSLIMLVLGITYAWFEWQSSTNTNVTFEVGDLGITYIGEENILSKVLYPTANMTNPDNIIHNFSLTTSSNIDIYTKISLDIINIDEELKDISFVWKLYRGDTYIAGGNFASSKVGEELLLTPYEKITNDLTNYTLYIWIDGTLDNPVDMGGKRFNFKLKFSAGQVSYVTDEECFTFDESTGAVTDYLCVPYNKNDLPVITDIVIPSEINGISVTTIGEAAFSSNGLTSIYIPDSVTSIGGNAFRSNNLTEVTIPESVETIGNSAFQNNKINSLTLVSGIKKINFAAFANNNLTDITLPNTVTFIGAGAFAGNALTNVYIPSSVTKLEGGAFTSKYLESIKVDSANTVYTSGDNDKYVIDISSNTLVHGTPSGIIKEGIVSIGSDAFSSMGLTEVEIPSSVKIIGGGAFSSNNLSSLTLPEGVETIGNYAFSRNNLISIYISSTVTQVASLGAFNGNSNLESIIVSSKNKKYDSRDNSNAMIHSSSNTLVVGCKNTVIPSSVTVIGDDSFNAKGLTEIEIPEGVTLIGNRAFVGNNLTEIEIPSNVETIGYNAFLSNSSSNPNLTTIYNLTERVFNWGSILGTSSQSFVTGTIGKVTITTK